MAALNRVINAYSSRKQGNFGERYVHRGDDDHDFYHQDQFELKRTHHHLKFKYPLQPTQFKEIIEIFALEQVISPAEKNVFIKDFEERNQAARAALAAVCTPEEKDEEPLLRKQKDERALLRLIARCQNIDLLVHLHSYLLEQKFDYLRIITDADRHPKAGKEWQGRDRSGELVKTSRTWAKLEKAISLQMIRNFRCQVEFTPQLGAERSWQFSTAHSFFGIKRSRFADKPDEPRVSKTVEAFKNGDAKTLIRKYKKAFS